MAIKVAAQLNALSNAYGAGATHAALFATATPPTDGTATGEVSGGSPAYARKAITWGAPTAGVSTASVTFDVPAGTTVRAVGVASSSSGSTIRDWVAVTDQPFATQGQMTINFTSTIT